MKKLFPSTIFVAAVVLLLAISGRAAGGDTKISNSVEGMVVPDNVYDRQPFSFSAPQHANKTVTVQTVQGVVVQDTSTDKYGRVFLAAGLPAGAYLISTSGRPLGKIEVQQRAGDVLQHSPRAMELQNPPQALKLSDQLSLNGHGFSPNAADMHVSFSGAGTAEAPTILAATEDQVKLAPVQELQPGMATLRVNNQTTGQSTDAYDLLLYDIQGKLVRRTLKSGKDQTDLVITTKPGDLTVRASVISGPVDFGDGRKEIEGVTSNGQAIFPVHAERGAGPFQIDWTLAISQPCPDLSTPVGQDSWTQEQIDSATRWAKKKRDQGRYGAAASYEDSAAGWERARGNYGKAAEHEEQAAKDHRAAGESDKAAEREKQAAKDRAAQANKDGDPCNKDRKDNKTVAQEYRQAAADYKQAADDYPENSQDRKDMNDKAEEMNDKADELDPK